MKLLISTLVLSTVVLAETIISESIFELGPPSILQLQPDSQIAESPLRSKDLQLNNLVTLCEDVGGKCVTKKGGAKKSHCVGSINWKLTCPDKHVCCSGKYDPPTIETCNKSIVVSHNMTEYWMSPLYDGGLNNYTAGTYTCQLTITVPAETLYIVNMEMQSPSEVYDTVGCTGDSLVYTSMGHSHRYCGEMSSMEWTEMQLYEAEPKTVTLTFMSENSDGGVAGGFNLTLTAMDAASH